MSKKRRGHKNPMAGNRIGQELARTAAVSALTEVAIRALMPAAMGLVRPAPNTDHARMKERLERIFSLAWSAERSAADLDKIAALARDGLDELLEARAAAVVKGIESISAPPAGEEHDP